MIIGELDEEYKGWISVKTGDNNEGWAPVEFIEICPEKDRGIGKCQYSAAELNTLADEGLELISELNGWYLAKNRQGMVGWVSIKTVERA